MTLKTEDDRAALEDLRRWCLGGADIERTESPIEKTLLIALASHRAAVGTIREQVTISTPGANYRADLTVERGPVRIVVEADGHAFHERTREQVARDNRRIRALLVEGWLVMRFSGSEINNDAEACALEVEHTVVAWLDRLSRARKGV